MSASRVVLSRRRDRHRSGSRPVVAVGEIPHDQWLNANGLIAIQAPVQAESEAVLTRVPRPVADIVVAIAVAVDDDVVAKSVLRADPVVVRPADLNLPQDDEESRLLQARGQVRSLVACSFNEFS